MRLLIKKYAPPFLWNIMRTIRRRILARNYLKEVRSFQRHVVSHTYGGFPLQVAIGDPVGMEWYDKDWPLLPELELLSRHKLKPGARVFDIGAHQGVVAMMISRLVTASGKVVALDPNPTNIELATENCRLNGIDNVTLMQAAAGNCQGSVRFGHHLNDLISQDGIGYDVDVLTIDFLTSKLGRPDVVFVDVEGFEGEVLKGASVTLDQCVCDWFVEVHMNGSLQGFGWTCEQILAFFPTERYSRFIASEEEGEFVSIESAPHLLRNRFFLIAIDNRPV